MTQAIVRLPHSGRSADPHPVRPLAGRGLGPTAAGHSGTVNAITDVPGVEVGYTTLIRGRRSAGPGEGPGPDRRDGHPSARPERDADPVQAGWFSFNGNGEMTGTTLIEETGFLSTPILITNTHSVGAAHEGAIRWLVAPSPQPRQAMGPAGGRRDLGRLPERHQRAARHPRARLRGSGRGRSGPIEEGSVGGGTGMVCYGFKGGSGTASRRVEIGGDLYTVGVFMQANFGWRPELTIAGVPVGVHIREDNPMDDVFLAHASGGRFLHHHRRHRRPAASRPVQGPGPAGAAGPGPHRHHQLPLLGRHLPGLLHRQPG